MENVFDLISRSVSNQQDIILLFVDLQSFGNFDWFPSLGPQPLNSSKFYGLQTLFQSAQVHSVSFVSFWLSKCPFSTKERCRKHQRAMFSMENRDNSHGLEMFQPSFSGFCRLPTELQLHWMKCNTFLEILILLGVLCGKKKSRRRKLDFTPPFKGHQNLFNRGDRTLLQRRSTKKHESHHFVGNHFVESLPFFGNNG